MFGCSGEVVEVKINSRGAPRPVCPHCEKELEAVTRHRGSLNLLRHLDVFSCPHCRKVLGTCVTFK